MHKLILALLLLGLAGCAVPFTGPSSSERKAPCDRLAAQAIQTDSFEEAKNLTAQASACYSRAAQRE